MRHKTSRELFQYWNLLRGEDPAPSRHVFEPAYIGNILPSVFMLELVGDIASLNLAGGDICAMFGDDLRGKSFSSLWLNGVERKPSTIIAQCANEQKPFVIVADGLSTHGTVNKLEMILLPLVSEDGKFDRVIGSLSQLNQGFAFNNKHIIGMSLTAIRQIDKDTIPVDFNALGNAVAIKSGGKIAEDAKQIGHLFVIDGGVKN
ncbi:MAG: PAS domain-containing protein [Rhizobiaceae bacterium]|nr:PAS domain-containing protein [Rhizobiaceae bacterium]